MTETADLSFERLLDAPPELLFKTWSDPELIKRWWAPRPYETPEAEIDLAPGGKFYTRMTGPDGFDFKGTACIIEAVPGRRIVWSTALLPDYRPAESFGEDCGGFPFTAVHEFADAGGGKTRYAVTVRHRNAADAKAHVDMGFEDGWATCAEQMAEVARSLAVSA